jgi:hypothetical protein
MLLPFSAFFSSRFGFERTSYGSESAEQAQLIRHFVTDLNAFFASCEEQENPTLRGQPVIVVQTLTDSAVAIAASYAAKAFGIKTGTVVRDARRLCRSLVGARSYPPAAPSTMRFPRNGRSRAMNAA